MKLCFVFEVDRSSTSEIVYNGERERFIKKL